MAFLVVFDGYSSGPTIKDVAHERRSKGLKGNQTIFDRNTPFKSKKEISYQTLSTNRTLSTYFLNI